MIRLHRPGLAGLLTILAMVAAPSIAAEIHVDPAATGGDGSTGAPYASVAAAFASGEIAGGDVIHLAEGDHGALRLDRVGFDAPVTLRSDPAAPARFDRIDLANTRNIVIEGARVWGGRPASGGSFFLIEESGAGNAFEDLDIRSRPDAPETYRDWDKQTWLDQRRGGMRLRGRDVRVTDNRFWATGDAIGAIGPGARITGNIIRGFAGDGLRTLGDDTRVADNYVADCVKIDGNHDDGIQSWTTGPDGVGSGTVRGLVIEANTFVEWSSAPDEDHPLRCELQGIGLFDGMFEDLVVANNVIAVSGYHGIAVAGANNSRIVNNTLINPRIISRERPWITLGNHKDGTASTGNLVANNLAPNYRFSGAIARDNTLKRNLTLVYPHREMDFDPALPPGAGIRLKPGSGLLGAADPARAPSGDRTGAERDTANGIDPGAYEGAG